MTAYQKRLARKLDELDGALTKAFDRSWRQQSVGKSISSATRILMERHLIRKRFIQEFEI